MTQCHQCRKQENSSASKAKICQPCRLFFSDVREAFPVIVNDRVTFVNDERVWAENGKNFSMVKKLYRQWRRLIRFIKGRCRLLSLPCLLDLPVIVSDKGEAEARPDKKKAGDAGGGGSRGAG